MAGPDFISKVTESSEDEERAVLPNNAALEALGDMIPAEDKGNFLTETFKSVEGWMQNLMESQGLNSSVISDHLGGFVEIADDKLDYVAAFLDASTNYYEHTGIQTVARKLINTAYEEWQAEINNDDDDEDE